MRFADKRSRAQIAQYRLHELHASRWRNAKNLERWNEHLRSQWEISQLGPKRVMENPDSLPPHITNPRPVDFEDLPC